MACNASVSASTEPYAGQHRHGGMIQAGCPDVETGGITMISHKTAGFTVLIAGLFVAVTRGLANTATGWVKYPKISAMKVAIAMC